MSDPMDEELARLVYEELIVEFPGYKAVPEPMAKALIRLGVNNGIRFSTVSTDKLSVEKLQEQLNTAKKALTEISKTKDFYRSGRDHWEEFSQDALKAQKALAEIGNEGSGDE